MGNTVDVTIPVAPETAALMADERNRIVVGQLVDRALRPAAFHSEFAPIFAETRAAAREAGLTDEEIDAELAAFKAERRARRPDV